jgi:hypothetical protein
VGQFAHVLLQVVDLAAVGLARVYMFVLQFLEGFVLLLNYAVQLLTTPFELPAFEFHLAVLLLHQGLQFLPFALEGVDQVIVVFAHGFDVNRVQTGQSLLHVEQFLLVGPLSFVDLVLQQLNFAIKFLPFLGVVLQGGGQFAVQFINLVVLHLYDLA